MRPGSALEGQIFADFKDLFRTRDMVERVWAAAGRLIAAERPEFEAEAGKIARDLDRAGEQLERYFRALEDGSMNPQACASRVSTP